MSDTAPVSRTRRNLVLAGMLLTALVLVVSTAGLPAAERYQDRSGEGIGYLPIAFGFFVAHVLFFAALFVDGRFHGVRYPEAARVPGVLLIAVGLLLVGCDIVLLVST